MLDIYEKAKKIKLIIFDVDGVLTDGSLFFGDDGQEYKAFNAKDGHGMKMLQRSGVEVAIITARSSELVKHRMKNLEIKHVYQGQKDKLPAFKSLIDKLKIHSDEVAYVGDDVVDLPIMIRVGLAVSVADGHPLSKKHAHWITPTPGGRGAARDICELIMQAQGTLEPMIQEYLTMNP
ncbi:MAG: 3-deoxy-manno-octulosonate-8-phosphatase KdsC [Gammaproteobacteria bacterium]|nr:3-deoxy-manno-octulosonate-8-phosphatase KdsC [Gammaproteobacteria bacterium]MDH5801549.1 3-deoxy-manno-octulosonate-8-phosphatase KdsC [Gammaproteobacteria bacterium]